MKKHKFFTRLAAAVFVSAAILTAPAALAQSSEKPYTYVEQMPQFRGGEAAMLKFLGSNIRYPQEASATGLEGLVVVSFVVDTDGSISDVQTLKKLGQGTDEEAQRVIKLMDGKWKPGSQSGKLVPVRYTLPIRFALSEADRAAVAAVANRVPQFKGGQEAMVQTISQHLQLPEEAKQENLNARVIVKFTVETDGSVSNIRLEKTKLKKIVGPGSEFDYMDASSFNIQNKTLLARLAEAAVSAVRSTTGQWAPAMQSGKPVAAELALPVQFLGSEVDKINSQQMDVPAMQKLKPQKDTYHYKEVDVKPLIKGVTFEKFLAKNLRYPANSSFEGDMKLTLLVKDDGKMAFMIPVAITDDEPLYEELKRVLKLAEGNWSPGKIDGQPVSTGRILTIRFVIDNGTKNPAAKAVQQPDVIVTKYK